MGNDENSEKKESGKRECRYKSVFIATPSGSGEPAAEYTASLMKTVSELSSMGVSVRNAMLTGCSIVDKARLLVLHQFMKTDAECIFWIDDDVGWDFEDFFRVLNHEEEIVYGGYRVKDPSVYRIHADLMWDGDKPINNGKGLLKSYGGPGGFVRVDRCVYETLDKSGVMTPLILANNEVVRDYYPIWREAVQIPFDDLPDWAQNHPQIKADEDGNATINRHYGEDIMFMRLARTVGFDIWCDPDVTLTHSGHMTLSGSVSQLVSNKDLRPSGWGPHMDKNNGRRLEDR